MELFVFSSRRSWPFPRGVLKLWDLSRTRRSPKLCVALELLVSSRGRRRPKLRVVLELWALRLEQE
jgi:hypothetical protein